MKTLVKIFLMLVIILTGVYSTYVFLAGPCRNPIEYSLGSFSTKFGITETEFLASIKKAEDAWEKALGEDLFNYVPDSTLKINLIFDERQETAIRNKVLGTKVDETERSAESVRAEFEALKLRYETGKADYDQMVTTYTDLQKVYNSRVEYWNSQGGAPKKEFNELQNQKVELQRLQGLIEQRRLEVNQFAKAVNDIVAKYNYLVESANSVIEVINQSADKEFEQGEYVYNGGKKNINIYEFYEKSELERILAHEFGHALGMDHNKNAASIMYYLNKGKGLVPSAEDIADLKQICKIK